MIYVYFTKPGRRFQTLISIIVSNLPSQTDTAVKIMEVEEVEYKVQISDIRGEI